VSRTDDFWIPLVDEPIGSIVEQIQRDHPEIERLVSGPRRILAFRTFAYVRVGILLGSLLVESEAQAEGDADTWVETLLADPRHHDAVVREVRAVAEEIAGDPRYGEDAQVGPDDDARERFRAFARKQLG